MFVKLEVPGITFSFWILNVLEFREDPPTWQGAPPRRTFDGGLISTQRDPRRSWSLTAEFLTVSELESFKIFLTSGVDIQTRRMISLRPLNMRSDPSPIGALSNGGPILIMPEIGACQPSVEEVVGGQIRQRWTIDLVLREI